MKAMDVSFHPVYGSLICVKGLQSDRPKCKRLLADPGEYQNMIIKYLSVGLQSWFSYQQVALNPLFQMRYDSLPNSEKQPSDSQRGWSNSCFHISLVLFLLPASKTCLSNLVSHSVTSWSRWGYHTSFERGDWGLPADMKIRTVIQLIGILWSYFGTLRGLTKRSHLNGYLSSSMHSK